MNMWVSLLSIFLVFVAPVWIIMHYRSKRHIEQGLTEKERQMVNELVEKSNEMQKRIETLELILDHETPSWRRDYE